MTDKKNACRGHDQMTLYRCAEQEDTSKDT